MVGSPLSPLDRKLLRDLWRIKGHAVAIALVTAAGLATLIMSLGALNSLEETKVAYYERYRFAQVFAAVKRAPDRLAARIGRIPGVKAVETRIVKTVILDLPGLDEPALGRLISLPEHGRPSLNNIALRLGRSVTPGHPDEAVISEAFADAHGFRPGDGFSAIINGRKRRLQVVGIALSPEYIYSIGPGALMPDDKRFGVLWMGHAALAAAFDLEGAFNDVSLALLRKASAAEVVARLDDLLEPYGGTGAIERKDQTSHWFLSSELEQLGTVATVLPAIFIAVSVFLLNVTVSRLVETEREQIGLLKAFGYSSGAVGRHYLKLVLALAALGILAGCLTGAWLGREITELYTRFYRFPFLYYRPGAWIFGVGALSVMAAAIAGTLNAVRRAIAIPPAQAMVPSPPPLYRRGLLERLGLAGAFDQPTLMILRHLGRWPLRSALTVAGVGSAVAVLISSLHWIDAIEHMIEVEFFETQRQDVTVTLEETGPHRVLYDFQHLPGVLAVEPYRSVPARLRFAHRTQLESVTGVPPDAELNPLRDVDGRTVTIPEQGLVVSAKLAELLGAKRGDSVIIEVLEGRRPVSEARVAEVFETYLGTPAYMRLSSLNRLMREGPTVSGAYLLLDSRHEAAAYRTLKNTPMVAGTALRTAAIRVFRETMAETINIIVSFYVIFAGLLALGVVYNSVRISLSERGRDLATLRVLGFTRGEVSYILLGELALVTLVALPLGCIFGYGLARMLSGLFETELYRIPMVIEPATYGFSAAVIAVAALGSGLIVRRRLDRLDLIAVLKTRE